MNKIIYSILLFVLLYNIIYSKDIFEHQPNKCCCKPDCSRRHKSCCPSGSRSGRGSDSRSGRGRGSGSRRRSTPSGSRSGRGRGRGIGSRHRPRTLSRRKHSDRGSRTPRSRRRSQSGNATNMPQSVKLEENKISQNFSSRSHSSGSNDMPIPVKLEEKKISPHQICYMDGNGYIHRYTNYNTDLKTTLEKHVIDNNSNIKILNNDIEIDNKKYKLFECGKSNGDLDLDNDNTYTSDILNNTHKCIKISDNYGFISKGNNINRDSWGGNDDICNRIVSYTGKYFHKDTDTNWPTTGGCTIYSDDKCQKIKEVVDFPGNYPDEFKIKYKKEIAARN